MHQGSELRHAVSDKGKNKIHNGDKTVLKMLQSSVQRR